MQGEPPGFLYCVGAASIRVITLDATASYLEAFIVPHSDDRGRGDGRKLMQQLIEWADANWVTLWLACKEPWVREWYERLGFVQTPDWPAGWEPRQWEEDARQKGAVWVMCRVPIWLQM